MIDGPLLVRDLNDSVNQSLFFSIFLKSMSILFNLIPLVKYSLSVTVCNFTLFSSISKILNAFNDDSGIIGYNKKLIFLIISKDV